MAGKRNTGPQMPKHSWDASLHPRDARGRFIRTRITPDGKGSSRAEAVRNYYLKHLNQFDPGFNILAIGADPQPNNQFASVDETQARERVHMVGSIDGNLMAVSASEHGCWGVSFPDKVEPPEPFSLARYDAAFSEVEKHGRNMPNYGGTPVQMCGRNDGKVYDTLGAQDAEQTVRDTFADENVKKWETTPTELADAAVAARHWYQDNMTYKKKMPDGSVVDTPITEAMARRMPVHVYFYGKYGHLRVQPALKLDEKTGEWVPRRSPNTKGAGGTVKTTIGEITRRARALQFEHVGNMEIAVARGSQTDCLGNKRDRNAIYMRSTILKNGQTAEVWGTIENENPNGKAQKALSFKDRTRADAKRKYPKDEKKQKQYVKEHVAGYEEMCEWSRMQEAKPYHNPKDTKQAATLLQHRYEKDADPAKVTMRKDGGFSYKSNTHLGTIYDPKGERSGYEAYDSHGFTTVFNRKFRSKHVQISDDMVRQREDGSFDVTIPTAKGDLNMRYSSDFKRLR